MSQIHNFHMLWCCTFILGVMYAGLLFCSKVIGDPYDIKGTQFLCYILFTEFNLDKK